MSAGRRRRELRIGDVAKLAGTTPRTIRYYEEIGLLPAAGDREPGAHRTYEEGDVERLTELLRLKDLLGISLEELKELVRPRTPAPRCGASGAAASRTRSGAARSSRRASATSPTARAGAAAARRDRQAGGGAAREAQAVRAPYPGACSSKCLLSIVTWPW